VPREGYRLGVPRPGRYRVALNSDSAHYGGANLGSDTVDAEHAPAHGQTWSVVLDLPPLAGMVLLPF
jgi:1,4-alpha-glucan branching enzyme